MVETSAPGQVTRTRVRVASMLAYAVLLAVWIKLLGIPNDAVQVFVWLWFGTIAWHIEAPWRYHLRFLRDWSLPMLGLIVYFYSRGLTDELGLPVHYTMPIRFDEWMFGGTLPTEWLQEHLCGDPCERASHPRWYDVLLTTVYASHFLTGLTIAAVLWVRDRSEWVLWMRRYLAINFGALVIYLVYPMAPPWMASELGLIEAALPRLTGRGWADLGLGRFDLVLQGVGNPVAAMPSLHAGIAFLVAMYGIWRLRTPLRFLLVLYPFAMSFALVYYAEHYVVDILAGALLAALVMIGCRLWERRLPNSSRTGSSSPPIQRRTRRGCDTTSSTRRVPRIRRFRCGTSCPRSTRMRWGRLRSVPRYSVAARASRPVALCASAVATAQHLRGRCAVATGVALSAAGRVVSWRPRGGCAGAERRDHPGSARCRPPTRLPWWSCCSSTARSPGWAPLRGRAWWWVCGRCPPTARSPM